MRGTELVEYTSKPPLLELNAAAIGGLWDFCNCVSLLLSFKRCFYAHLLAIGRSAGNALFSVREKCVPKNDQDDVIWSIAQIFMWLKNINLKKHIRVKTARDLPTRHRWNICVGFIRMTSTSWQHLCCHCLVLRAISKPVAKPGSFYLNQL